MLQMNRVRKSWPQPNTYCDACVALLLLEMGVGLSATIVMTFGEPSLFVLVRVWVTNGGALVMVCPALLVVVTKTVDCSVVLCNAREVKIVQ